MNRVVITGIGVVSPVGIGQEQFWTNLTGGISGIGPITLFDASSLPICIGGEVKNFNIQSVIDEFPCSESMRDRKVLLGLSAAKEALADACIDETSLGQALLYTGVGLEMFCLEDLTPYANSPDVGQAIARTLLRDMAEARLQSPLDVTSNILGDRYGFSAGKYINCSACAAGAQVIGEAWNMLCHGQAKVALAGATDSMLNPLGLGGFSLLRILCDENDQPQRACRPFDISRKGTVLGEGSAFVVMETLGNALERKASIYAEVIGYGSSMDAFRVSDPDNTGRGAVQSMSKALDVAGIKPDDIDCVNAHGTGTIKNDIVETAAIKEVLRKHAYNIPVHSVKSMTGHMIAASGAVEAVA
ncbi:MAG TPA: beta-ketoacyl-[acyl-carrier-protein] synthase family protein, partial [Sedimentisphaerales bacterium]|nr:beta-ketoacyl-[acyl-carrier-protein] synthase family protein [Sedimentisphaerales bacterium]